MKGFDGVYPTTFALARPRGDVCGQTPSRAPNVRREFLGGALLFSLFVFISSLSISPFSPGLRYVASCAEPSGQTWKNICRERKQQLKA